jgi:putative aminopeptidase FrvX
MRAKLQEATLALMQIAGLSGYEGRVRAEIRGRLAVLGSESCTDKLGNLITTFEGAPGAPSVMVFAHMDQLGFIVRKIEDNGLIRVERMGGVPERALASQSVLLMVQGGADVPGFITNKSHHATTPDQKYTVLRAPEICIDTGHGSMAAVHAAGVQIGTPVVYAPMADALADGKIVGTSVDDRAGCAVLLAVAEALQVRTGGPTVHLVFSVQEEFNLRGAVVAAQSLQPDIAIQLDLMLATDTPDMADRGDMILGGGPGMSLYSFHGRGTLNGVIPHPALTGLIEQVACDQQIPLQRSAQVGILTDLSYVQLVGDGVASLELGFPMRYSHSSREMCDLGDLEALSQLLIAALAEIRPGFSLDRDESVL